MMGGSEAQSPLGEPSGVIDGIDASAPLRAALESRYFRDSRRQSALLTYLIKEECAGRGERISAYSIAFDVLGRDHSFDPAIDSIVRVEMHRLRTNLQDWNADLANHETAAIEILPRSYRPRLKARSPQLKAQMTARDWRTLARKPWVVAAVLLGLVGVIALMHRQYATAQACRSSRPELDLPVAVANLPAAASESLINRVKQMLEYYPLVTGGKFGFSQCAGVPKYDLGMSMGAQSLNLILRYHEGGQILQTFDIPYNPDGAIRDQDIAAARIAFRLGYDAGYIANDAMRRKWNDPDAEEQFVCLMRSHQYFYANAGPTIYAAVRACLIREFRRASMADVPAMLAAIELEPKADPALQRFQTHNYYDEAVMAATSIDRFSAELMIAQLRAMRMETVYRRGDAQIVIQTLDRVYPYEPYVRNQVSMTQCKVTQEYAAGYRNIALYKEIIMGDLDLPYAEVYCNIATDNVAANRPYFGKLLNDTSPYIQLLNLYMADKLNDPGMEKLVLGRMRQLDCTDRSCLLAIVPEVRENPDIFIKLRSVIDKYFPGTTKLIDRAGPATAPGTGQ